MKTLYTLGESFRCDNNLYTSGVFLDYSKAIHCKRYDLAKQVGSPWNKRDSFNHSYFSNRQQYVELHGCFIEVKPARRRRIIFRPNVIEFCGNIRPKALLSLLTIPEIICCSRSSPESRVLQFFPAFSHSPTTQKRFSSVMCFFLVFSYFRSFVSVLE